MTRMHGLTADFVRQILNYDPETGIFIWKIRKIRFGNEHADRIFNGHFGGNAAGSIAPEGYVVIGVQGKVYRAHRLAWLYMTGEWPDRDIDHINGDKSDNRIANLRSATKIENKRNRRRNTDNTSGCKGVSWHKRDQKWYARIMVDGKSKSLGYYKSLQSAHAAYCAASQKYHGEFGNFG